MLNFNLFIEEQEASYIDELLEENYYGNTHDSIRRFAEENELFYSCDDMGNIYLSIDEEAESFIMFNASLDFGNWMLLY